MRRRGPSRLLLVCGLAATIAATSARGDIAPRVLDPTLGTSTSRESWYDDEHGWRLGGTRDAAGFYGSIQESNDGGRSWRTVYRGRRYRVGSVLRMSREVGIARVAAPGDRRMILTRDAGRTWQKLRKDVYWTQLDGAGRNLFVVGAAPSTPDQGIALYRVANWPTLAPRLRLLYRTTAALPLLVLRSVPGGVAALEAAPAGTATETPFRLVVARFDHAAARAAPNLTTAGGVYCGVRRFAVDWPTITVVVGIATPGPHDACGEGVQRPVVFSSGDDGRTWTVLPR